MFSAGAPRATARVLSAITALRKLCNHPKLIYDAARAASRAAGPAGGLSDGFAGCDALFPPGWFDPPGAGGGRAGMRGRLGGGATMPPGWEAMGGKFSFATALLEALMAANPTSPDRVVIVSNATQTLDLFAVLCKERGWPCLRLDGSTSVGRRTTLVKQFCDPARGQFVFLLSSKAGGCGLNLVGANRLILFDPAWNPADDKQAGGGGGEACSGQGAATRPFAAPPVPAPKRTRPPRPRHRHQPNPPPPPPTQPPLPGGGPRVAGRPGAAGVRVPPAGDGRAGRKDLAAPVQQGGAQVRGGRGGRGGAATPPPTCF